jgi:putative addiction module killer protein
MERTIVIYESNDGKCPFQNWLNGLGDIRGRATIRARLERVRLGNLGDCKSIGGGIFELRVQYGSGYRVYFGQDSLKLVVLLCGGDKGSQGRDIIKAKVLWKEYRNASKKLSR